VSTATLILLTLLSVASAARAPAGGDDDRAGVELLRESGEAGGRLLTFEAGRDLGAGTDQAPRRRDKVPPMRRMEVPKSVAPEAREPAPGPEEDVALEVGAEPLDAQFHTGRSESDQTQTAANRVEGSLGFRLLGGRSWVLRAQIRHELSESGSRRSDGRRSEVAVALQRRF
jgi:hypothetical protein